MYQKQIIHKNGLVSDSRWALHLEKMRDTGDNMSPATRNTCLGQSSSVFVQQYKAWYILYIIVKKLHFSNTQKQNK